MKRALALAALISFGSLAWSAPVPKDAAAEKAKLEALWKDMSGGNILMKTRAILALIDNSGSEAFVMDKVEPVKASKEEIEGWLKDLNSSEEAERKTARHKLLYHHPSMHLSPQEQLKLIDTEQGRRELVNIWTGYQFARNEPNTRSEITLTPKGDATKVRYTTTQNLVDGGSVQSGMDFDIAPLKDHESLRWNTACSAELILDRLKSPKAKDALIRLSKGFPTASPTRFANELLLAKAPETLTQTTFDRDWKELLGRRQLPDGVFGRDHYDGQTVPRIVLNWSENPESVKFLKGKLPAIKADAKKLKAWLKDLDSEDDEVWKPAYRALIDTNPKLGLSDEEILAVSKSDRYCSRLFYLYFNEPAEKASHCIDCHIEVQNGYLYLHHTLNGQRQKFTVTFSPIAEYSSFEFLRAQFCVLALERLGTADAKDVLKQLAEGHPEIGPTKDAKAALERMKARN